MSEPLLSVCLITYNHSKYIKEAIDGVLMQKVNFSWELIVADDYSTDGTREILLAYKERYPDFIKLILQKKNVGPANNWIDLITSPKSKYIAYFEGDDYWTDALKLQKQIDFLENNLDYTLCFHNAMIKHEGIKGKDQLFCSKELPETTEIDYLISNYYIPSASMVFRNDAMDISEWFKFAYNGDYALQLVLANKGKFKYLNEVMTVYRKNIGGQNAKIKNSEVWFKLYETLSYFDIYTNFKFHNQIIQKKEELKICAKKALNSEKGIFLKLISPEFYYYKTKRLLQK